MNQKILTKVLAVTLAITLSCANFIFVALNMNEVFAAAIEYEKQETAINKTDISFDAYFMTDENEKTHTFTSAMENNDLKLYVDVSVVKGYLENAKVSISNSNFRLKEVDEIIDGVEVISSSDNTVTLNQVSKGENKVIVLPIEVVKDEAFDITNFSKDANVTLTGIFTNDSAKKIDFEKTLVVNLSLSEEAETFLSGKVLNKTTFKEEEKNKEFIQLEIESAVVNNALPVKSSKIEVKIPEIEGRTLEYVSVYAESTKATNGDNGDNFSKDNYKVEDGTIYINVENKFNEENNIISWSKNSTDKYIVNLVYSFSKNEEVVNIELEDNDETEKITVNELEDNNGIDSIKLDVTSKLSLYNNEEKVIEKKFEEEVSLEEIDNKIISTKVEGTNELAKGYMLIPESANTEYTQDIELNIGYKTLIKDINISKVRDEYVDEEKETTYSATTYYKKISLRKENLEKILGKEGKISIIKDEIEIGKLDSENLEYVFEEETTDIILKVSAPVEEGILNIETVKYIKSAEYDKKTVNTLAKMITDIKVESDLGDEIIKSEINLVDPILQAELKVSPSNLSTVVENENVEIRVTLKTNNNTQKLYKDPTIEVVLPSYIEKIKVNSINLFYDDELLPNTAELKKDENGNKVLILKVNGEQTKYNQNATVEGMTIIADVNITVNKTAPSITEKVMAKITNNNEEEIEESANIYYSAPTGIITLNTMSEYNGKEVEATSVSGQEVIGEIEKEAGSKIATETISVINNYDYTCGNMEILGRTPAEGNKNPRTNEDLGSTFTAKMVSGIKAKEGLTDEQIEVYYSENGEATKDLSNSANGWTKDVANFENIKSYLIVVNANLSKGDKIVLTYEIEIPENLERDESTYSMFEVYYTNLDGALSGVKEKALSQVVGVSTGESANLEVKVSANVNNGTEVKEGQIVEYKVEVKNNGKSDVKNAKVSVNIPEQANIIRYEFDEMQEYYYYANIADKVFEETIETLAKGETKTVTFMLKVGSMEDGKENKINVKADVEVKVDNETQTFTSDEISNPMTEGTFGINLARVFPISLKDTYNGAEVTYKIQIDHKTNKTYNNVVLSCALPNNLKYISSGINSSEKHEYNTEVNGSNIKWTIDKIDTGVDEITLKCQLQNIDENKENTVQLGIVGTADELNGQKVESTKDVLLVGKPSLEVKTITSNNTGILSDGDKIEYITTVKNVGNIVAYNVSAKEFVESGINVDKITVSYSNGSADNTYGGTGRTTNINLGIIKPGETVTIKLEARAYLDEGETSKVAKHSIEISGLSIKDAITSKETSYRVNPVVYSVSENKETETRYSISGLVWEDANKNGLREEDEKVLPEVPVLLLNQEGKTAASGITNEVGAYVFDRLMAGNYIVVFMYDTGYYDITTYRAGEASLDNDAVQMKLDLNNANILCAATNKIELNENKTSIDLGLVVSPKFDLSLTKTISKITVNTKKNTKTNEYKDVTLQKIEIPTSELTGATVAIEYKITVKNEGAVAGYAKRIVDYLSSTDLKFNSELNSDWYLGTDGNLYNSTMGDKLLNPGDTVTLKLVLTKTLSEKNTGITSNIAEIYEAYNDEGLNDYNSTVANKVQSENDFGHADIIVSIKTGVVLYIGVVLFTIAILTLGIFVINKKVIKI